MTPCDINNPRLCGEKGGGVQFCLQALPLPTPTAASHPPQYSPLTTTFGFPIQPLASMSERNAP